MTRAPTDESPVTSEPTGGVEESIGDTPDIGVWVPSLIETLATQSRVLESLRDLAASQAEAFGVGDAKEILSVLADRRVLLSKATQADDHIKPLLARWHRLIELEASGIEAQQVQVAALLGRVESLRDEILAHDSDSQKVLDQRRGEVAKSLAGMRQGRKAVNAYGPTTPGGPRYQDREG